MSLCLRSLGVAHSWPYAAIIASDYSNKDAHDCYRTLITPTNIA